MVEEIPTGEEVEVDDTPLPGNIVEVVGARCCVLRGKKQGLMLRRIESEVTPIPHMEMTQGARRHLYRRQSSIIHTKMVAGTIISDLAST